jgi:2-polyprenyl-6-methoxyphenol hydroxylase-like FAD-dependent oxidoreductase
MSTEGGKRVLVCGAGITGPTLAYWLDRYGYRPTLVEIAPEPRRGGYMIDFWGVGYDTAERMGLIPHLRQAGYQIERLVMVNAAGRRIGGFETDSLRTMLKGRFFSILRGDLAHEIYHSIDGKVETLFADTVTAISQDEDGCDVTFSHAAPRRFDLVIGADGLHSTIRRLAFGAGPFENFLGYYAASFAVEGYPQRTAAAYVSYTAPGRQMARYALRGNRTVFFLVFAQDTELAIGHHELAEQKRILHGVFKRDRWECPAILAALDRTDTLYFDAVSQSHVPSWSRGRVVLLGDAAYCPSLLAGQGAALAMLGAYVLAGELKRAEGDIARALRCYEQRLRPFVEAKQQGAPRLGGWFAPRTSIGLFVRNQLTRLMAVPLIGKRIIANTVADKFSLPDYDG